ncbi:MAG: hypothetical protein AB8E15_08020 [Bdellovibrionales bacterium]
MNVKSISNPILVTDVSVQKTDQKKTLETSADRDSSQNQYQGQNPNEQEFHEEDVPKILEFLKNHPGVKTNHLTVAYEKFNTVYFFVIRDLQRKVVRKIPVAEAVRSMRANVADTEDRRGSLINKSA